MLSRKWAAIISATSFVILVSGWLAVASAQITPPPVPRLSLSVNVGTADQGYQGWAMFFSATILNPQKYVRAASVFPLVINAQGESWANNVQIVVTDPNGVVQNWPIKTATLPSGPLILDATNVGRLVWFVAPSDTSSIAAGTYSAVLLMDTTASAGTTGWNGIAYSNSVSVQISAPPSAPSSQQQEDQAELLAQYDHLLGNDPQAVLDLNSLLTLQPNTIGALALKGSLLAEMGQATNALAAYDQAAALFYAANPGLLPEAPNSILIPRGRLRNQLLSQSGLRGQPQAAIQLLDQGVQSPGVFYLDLQVTNVGNDVAENIALNQLTLQTLSGTGQVGFNNSFSTLLPVYTDFLGVNGAETLRIFVTVQGAVNTFLLTENGTVTDIFGTPSTFSQSQTVSLNFTGNLGPLAITASNATQQYGQPSPPLNSATYSGFVNGDTPASLSGVLGCMTTATQSSPVGTYPITCSGLTSSSYTITYVPGTLTITPAPLTVTANNVFRQYGQPNPSLTASFGGLVNGDTPSSLIGTLSCATAATQANAVGSYPINCTGLTSTNYTITFVQGNLTITPTPLTIMANSVARAYGAANPSLNNVTASGFVNGDTLASLTGTLVCATAANPTSPAGSYPILCSGLTSPNYSITYLQGTLTVTKALVTITANNATKILDAPNPTLTWTASGFENGDNIGVLTANPMCVTTATSASPVGSYSVTCSGANAANYTFSYVSGTLKILYSTALGHVVLAPINADGSSIWKQGRTVPAKFQVFDANGVSIGTPGVVISFDLTQIIAGTVTSVDESVSSTTPDSAFHWDPTGQLWIFNISTSNLPAVQTYVFTITLNDGTAIQFQFGLR